MTELKRRLISGLTVAGIVLTVLVLASFYPAAVNLSRVIISAIILLCIFEYLKFACQDLKERILLSLILVIPLCCFWLSVILDRRNIFELSPAVLLSFGSYLLFLFYRNNLEALSLRLRDFPMAVLQISIGGFSLLHMTYLEDFSKVLIWFLLLVCLNDVGAYFAGKNLGNFKLVPAISPGKTIVGSIGGIISGLFVGIIFGFLLKKHISGFYPVLGISFLILIAAQVGDLWESYFKRIHNVKDSGTLLPGHGGFLDRLDAVLLAAVVFNTWLFLAIK